LELSPTSLGSDVSFVRQLGQAYHFRPVGPLVLASAGRLGIVTPRGGQALLPSELFLAGGPRTVRGVAENELGPRDFLGPTGGQAVLVMNQEVRFPIHPWVRGVGFFDAGNVFAEPGAIDFRRLVTAYGAGLRVATPFALLRIDYGRLWTNRGDLRRSEWTFGIGHTF
jgi:outer membrane protein assembly factor BamA